MINARTRTLNWVATHSVLVALCLIVLFPVVFVFLTSVMGPRQTLTGSFWPNPWTWSNYIEVFTKSPVWLWASNSFLYAAGATVFMLLSSVPAAYVLAKVPFRGSGFLFMLFIVAMVLPPQITVVPLYVMWAKAGLTGSLLPLVLPNLLGDAFSIFLLRQFFLTIPNDYLEASRLDGCGDWRTLLRVVVPMARPGIAAAALFVFVRAWNDYFGPLLYTSENQAAWTISFGLGTFKGTHGTDWGATMALTIIATLPIVVVFFLAQRTFVQGVTMTGVKG
jgi:multiple sugar transport system permease protein